MALFTDKGQRMAADPADVESLTIAETLAQLNSIARDWGGPELSSAMCTAANERSLRRALRGCLRESQKCGAGL